MLNLSAKGDYGLMLLKVLNELAKGQYASLSVIAREQHLPLKYLEQVAASLAGAGIIISKHGKNGGYRLARPGNKIKLTDVIEALEQEVEPVHCSSKSSVCASLCERQMACERKTGWQALHRELFNLLKSKTLADVFTSL